MAGSMAEFRAFLAMIGTSIRSSASLKASFFLQVVFLLLSNMVFFSFWYIYFSTFNAIKGWTIYDLAGVYGLVNGGYGLFCLFLGGTRYLARMIMEGSLDAMIVKPKSILLQVMASNSAASGWGDVLSSIIFLLGSGYLTWPKLPLIALFLATSCTLIAGFSIVTGSLAFWLQDAHLLSKQIFEFLLTFSNYPKSIYSPGIKVILLTIVPSGMIGFMPMEVIKHASPAGVAMLLAFAVGYLCFARTLFYFGLRRYSSGSRHGFKL